MLSPAGTWHRANRWLSAHPFAADIVFALIVGSISMAGYLSTEVKETERAQDWLGAALVIGQTVSFAYRRRAVWWSFASVLAFTIVFWVADYPTNFDMFSLLTLYAAAAHGGDDRRLVWRRVGTAVVALTAIALLGVLWPSEDLPPVAVFGITTIHLTAAIIGETVYDRRRRIRELQTRAERAETERELLARQAVLDERARIAREMHDVVAHGMSVMVVQAGAAERALDADPDAARRALATIGAVGRDSLTEMRRMLGVLRDGDQPTQFEPQPTLADVAQLVTYTSDSGVPTELTVRGERPPLSAGHDITGYRIVQEALTNVLKHGGDGARARVDIDYRPDGIRLEVVDDGAGASESDVARATGQGVVGMRERVELFGGTLRVGPRPGGGFRVLATIPVQAAGDRRPAGRLATGARR